MFPFGEMRIYHCDLRLDNVVVDVSNIKLTDFGLAVKEEGGLDIQVSRIVARDPSFLTLK